MLARSLARRTFSTANIFRAGDRGGDGPASNAPPFSGPETNNPWEVLKAEFEKDVDSMIPRSTDVLIIGGGAIGCSVAYWLKKVVNLDVTVVERDPVHTMSATCLSVGGLRQQFSEPENIRMSLFGASFIRNIQEHLSVLDCDPPSVDFCPHGYLTLASEKGARQLEENYKMQVSCGAEVDLLERAMLKDRWPWMNVDDIVLGCFGVANEGWFDPYCLLKAVRRKALSLGVTFVHGELKSIEAQEVGRPGGRVQLREVKVQTPDGEQHKIHFSNIINAAGPWAQEVANMAGIGGGGPGGSLKLPVERRRRAAFVVRLPPAGTATPGIDAPSLVDPSGLHIRRHDFAGHFVVSRDDVRDVRGGGDAEDQEPSVSDLDVDYDFFDDHIWPNLAHRIPSMEAVKVLRAWAGYYDYNSLDQNLIIGNHPYFKNFFFCNGSSGHGIQHSMAIGRAISELIIFGEYKTIDLSRLSFDRFLTGDLVMEKNII